jgi:hypothetical protein
MPGVVNPLTPLCCLAECFIVLCRTGSSHLQLGMSAEPLHGVGFFGTYPGGQTAQRVPWPAHKHRAVLVGVCQENDGQHVSS